MRTALKSFTYSLLASLLTTTSLPASEQNPDNLIPYKVHFSFDSDTEGQILDEKLAALNAGTCTLEPRHLLRAMKNVDLQAPSKPGVTNGEVEIYLDPEGLSTRRLLEAAEELNAGKRTLAPKHLAEAITYLPADGELTVLELINKFWIYGMKDHFSDAVGKLAERGDPVARAFTGTDLVWHNFANKQSEGYIKGMYYLMYASDCGIADADNSLGMFLDYEGKTPMALSYLRMGTDFPHGHTNLGCIEEDSAGAQQMLIDFREAVKQGDPCAATALADYYAKPGPNQDVGEALKYYLISFHGYTNMDPFIGLGRIIEFVRTTKFEKGVAARAKEAARQWVIANRKIFGDGFDQTRATATPPSDTSKPRGIESQEDSVQGIFWANYALGDKEKFAKELKRYLDRQDANAWYMLGHLNRGFVGDPDDKKRRICLELANKKSNHPGAALGLAIDLIIDGALEETAKERKKSFIKAYEVLQESRKKWSNTIYSDAVSEVTFLMAYMIENGIGIDNSNPKLAMKFYDEVKYQTPLAMGRLAKLMMRDKPKTKTQRDQNVQAYAFLLASIPRFVTGDWFGGIRPMQHLMTILTAAEQAEARIIADEIVMKYDQISWNQYQRMFVSIYPAFSGLEEDTDKSVQLSANN